ncbi:MAG TPA: 3-deoxy-D-manno-octulosonic acid transferase [bacterium]|jgi:3-deoxy-D-manno-octulosonic-acid transferase|nr:3-deoxy-D-manno-octulosonic acid transferase [bacterium]
MFLGIYSLLLSLACLCLAPFLPVLLLFGRLRRGLGQRLGVLPKDLRDQALLSEGCLWIHAASLGEVNAVAPVVKELLPKLPRQALVFTCTSIAGREQARRLFPQAVACLLLPLDLGFFLGPWIRRFKPRLLVVAETELWPNFLRQARLHGAQILVANGRLTERSRARYSRLGSAFTKVLEDIDLFAMQSGADAARVISLGARTARVVTVGNTKFDVAGDIEAVRAEAQARRQELGWKAGAPVVVAGSTRPGEEAGLLAAFSALQKQVPGARLVLAPRHLERLPEVEALLKRGDWNWARRSQAGPAGDVAVLLLDTLGELRAFYGLACGGGAAWVGGSFKDFGGQNPLEAAALGVPVFFGPSMRHFAEVAQALLESGGARQVDEESLAEETAALLKDPLALAKASEALERCVRSRAGASRATADLGLKLLLVARMHRDGHLWREEGLESFRMVSEFGAEAHEPEWRDERPEQYRSGREFGMRLKDRDEPD